MSVALDSSVLIAAVLDWHEHHPASHQEVERLAASDGAAVIPTHALLESYSVITRLPAPHRLRPNDARDLLDGSFRDWVTAPAPEQIWSLIGQLADAEMVGGAAYDALIVESALAAGAVEIVTWNINHFQRAAANRLKVRSPN
ncbi:MAG: PIN domain-containing protein [Wenzhouxiangella sp.]|nr:MAG: PIN domain-containing protein [Wenzhouxiangella sp.]